MSPWQSDLTANWTKNNGDFMAKAGRINGDKGISRISGNYTEMQNERLKQDRTLTFFLKVVKFSARACVCL
jgi:hypothetical protein